MPSSRNFLDFRKVPLASWEADCVSNIPVSMINVFPNTHIAQWTQKTRYSLFPVSCGGFLHFGPALMKLQHIMDTDLSMMLIGLYFEVECAFPERPLLLVTWSMAEDLRTVNDYWCAATKRLELFITCCNMSSSRSITYFDSQRLSELDVYSARTTPMNRSLFTFCNCLGSSFPLSDSKCVRDLEIFANFCRKANCL